MTSTNEPLAEFISPLHHDEFLPPISPWLTWGGSFLVGTVGVVIAICALTPLPVTVKGQGIVRPTGEVKIVQAATEGIIKEIAVKENDPVKQGEIIAILDKGRFASKKEQLQGNMSQNRRQLEQISAQIDSLRNQEQAEANRINRTVAGAEADLQRIETEYTEKRQTTQGQVREAEANLQGNQDELSKLLADEQAAQAAVRGSESSWKIAEEKLNRYQNIATEGALGKDKLDEAKLQVTQAEQTLQERQANLEAVRKTIKRQENAIKATQSRLNQAIASVNPSNAVITMAKEKIAQEKATGEGAIARLNQEIQGLNQRKTELVKQIESDRYEIEQIDLEMVKTVITAPTEGVILKLNLRNTDQSVRNGDEIAQISPLNAPLVIKAKVTTQDRGKLQLGQKAQMRVAAYSYPDYGLLNGKVISISPDVIIPQQNNSTPQNPYYEVTIKPDLLYLKNDPKNAIKSGMEITADIISQEETVLKFIMRKARLFVDK
jgi:HlyD family secretion protein